jgi:dTDP-4-amino-4,6-dideoxygalactose transaminase
MTSQKPANAAKIPFHRATRAGGELEAFQASFEDGVFVGGGRFTQQAQKWIETNWHINKCILTPSCTAALEMAALLLDLKAGDEVIMPSYTFTTTASSITLRGATPVFVDVRPDTLNLDEKLLEAARTSRTKAVMPMHYAGVGCEMDLINDWADSHGISVVEDAAQTVGASFRGKALGSWGRFGAFSFHGTKNIHCGEGGALLVNRAEDQLEAEILRDKGTNRGSFFRGEVDKYTWIKTGSSFLMSEISAAILIPQLEAAERVAKQRMNIFNRYLGGLADLAKKEILSLPHVPSHCSPNGHIFYVLTRDEKSRVSLMLHLSQQGIGAVTHYVPLHSSPEGLRRGRSVGSMAVTNRVDQTLLRLPLWQDMGDGVDRVLESVHDWARGQ